MTKEQYFEHAKEFYEKCLETSRKKNADYTGNGDDPFANFTGVERLGISTEIGFITRMNDKLSRLASFVNNGQLQVKDESVVDTLEDLASYCCLMAGYLKSKNSFSPLIYDLSKLPNGVSMEDIITMYNNTGWVFYSEDGVNKVEYKPINDNSTKSI